MGAFKLLATFVWAACDVIAYLAHVVALDFWAFLKWLVGRGDGP